MKLRAPWGMGRMQQHVQGPSLNTASSAGRTEALNHHHDEDTSQASSAGCTKATTTMNKDRPQALSAGLELALSKAWAQAR
eukprot:scaffold28027_cov17-Tisochrysis_lutea.AAC.3